MIPFPDAPSGTSSSNSDSTGMIDTAMSIMTVPATVAVIIRRSSDSRADSRN